MKTEQVLRTGDSVSLKETGFIEGNRYPAGQQLIVYEDVDPAEEWFLIIIPGDTRTCLIGKRIVDLKELGRNERLLESMRKQLSDV